MVQHRSGLQIQNSHSGWLCGVTHGVCVCVSSCEPSSVTPRGRNGVRLLPYLTIRISLEEGIATASSPRQAQEGSLETCPGRCAQMSHIVGVCAEHWVYWTLRTSHSVTYCSARDPPCSRTIRIVQRVWLLGLSKPATNNVSF